MSEQIAADILPSGSCSTAVSSTELIRSMRGASENCEDHYDAKQHPKHVGKITFLTLDAVLRARISPKTPSFLGTAQQMLHFEMKYSYHQIRVTLGVLMQNEFAGNFEPSWIRNE